jgi:hypothetical protein
MHCSYSVSPVQFDVLLPQLFPELLLESLLEQLIRAVSEIAKNAIVTESKRISILLLACRYFIDETLIRGGWEKIPSL